MGVDNKGWVGGSGSMADAVFDRLWSGEEIVAPRVDIGPMTYLDKSARVVEIDEARDRDVGTQVNRVFQESPETNTAYSTEPPAKSSAIIKRLRSRKKCGEKTAAVPQHPLKLVTELTRMFGDEWRDWEPETIKTELEKQASADDETMSKVMALKIVLHRPDVFYDRWQAMEKIAVAFADHVPQMTEVEDVPVEWLSSAVDVVSKLAGEGDFGAETTAYVAARLFDQGYVLAPRLLKFADAALAGLVKNDALRQEVAVAYERRREVAETSEDPVDIQVARLQRNDAYVLNR